MRADIYWVESPEPGRLAILGRPRAGDWLVEEISSWKSSGITNVVSLLEDHEIRELDLPEEARMASDIGLSFERFAIPDRGVPASFATAHSCWSRLAGAIRAGRCVGAHCRAGIGRSGLMVAGTLIHLGVSEKEAWELTSRARGVKVPDTDAQREWLHNAFKK